MLVIFGTYSFAKKPVAYRADYCRSCEDERMTVGIRSFDAFHLFWIPVIPLGFWTRWHCGQCQAHPHEAVGTTPWVRWFIAVFVASIALTLWLAAFANLDIAGIEMWLSVALATFVSWLTIRWARNGNRVDYKAMRAQVSPFAGETCPLCDGHVLKALDGETCQQCEAEHRPLPQADGVVHMS